MKQHFLYLVTMAMTMLGVSQNPLDSLNQPCSANLDYSITGNAYELTLDAMDGTTSITTGISWSVNGVEDTVLSNSTEIFTLSTGMSTICATYDCNGQSNMICLSILVDGNGGGNPLDSIGNGGGNPLDSIIIVIDSIEFNDWFDNSWDSVVVDDELIDELEEWDFNEWSDSLIDIVFGNDLDVDDEVDSDDTYVITDSLDQNDIDSLFGAGVVIFTNDDLNDMWEDFLDENNFDGTNTSFDDLLEQFGTFVENKAQASLSVNEVQNSNIEVFFNSNTGELSINTENLTQISVYNMNGQIIFDLQTNANQVNLSSINTGIYVLVLEVNGKLYSQKIVK